jgi:hypothetical protein
MVAEPEALVEGSFSADGGAGRGAQAAQTADPLSRKKSIRDGIKREPDTFRVKSSLFHWQV